MSLLIKTSDNSYNIYVDEYINKNFYSYIDDLNKGQKFILCYPKNLKFHISKIISNLKSFGINILSLEIRDGEENKNFSNLKNLTQALIKMNCQRDSILISVGGGTTGDIVGFLASVYMRGIKYINVPTTLLSMVDSSVGGKTAINSNDVKNIIGTFHQPCGVFISTSFLDTLNTNHIRSGLGEIIKYGFIQNPTLLSLICENYDCIIQLKNKDLIKNIILESCKSKKIFVEKDVKDYHFRNILNFGHTLGHIIEIKYQAQNISHGEAILNGIYLSVKLSYKKGIMNESVYKSILDKFNLLKIEYTYKLNPFDLENIKSDKKSKNNNIRFVLLEDIGKPILVDNIELDELKEVI